MVHISSFRDVTRDAFFADTTDALPEFMRITKILDASRDENFEELYPEIAKDIKEQINE